MAKKSTSQSFTSGTEGHAAQRDAVRFQNVLPVGRYRALPMVTLHGNRIFMIPSEVAAEGVEDLKNSPFRRGSKDIRLLFSRIVVRNPPSQRN